MALKRLRTYFIRIRLLIPLCLISGSYCAAQNMFTKNFTIDDGLPSNSIQDIFKDSRGYYWIGTEAGLCKFDGVNFKVYTQRDGLPGDRIWSVTEDTKGNLWFACYGNGISRYDGHTFKNYSSVNGLVNDNVVKVKYSEKSNGLLIGTVFGFSFLKDSIFTSFKDTTITRRNLLQVTDFIDCDSSVYLLTCYDSRRFIKFNPYTKEVRYLQPGHRFHKGSYLSSCSYITSKKDTIIGNDLSGIKIFNGGPVRFINNMALVLDIDEEENGDVWIASWNDRNLPGIKGYGGVYRIRDGNAEFYGEKLGIKTQLCLCILCDKDENLLLIGTKDEGLYICPMYGILFYNASELNKKKPDIKDIVIDTKGTLWLSAGNRIIKKDNESTFTVKQLNYNKLTSRGLNGFSKLYEDDSKHIWVNSNIGLINLNDNETVFRADHRLNDEYPFFIEGDTIVDFLMFSNLIRYSFAKSSIIQSFTLRKNITYSSLCNYFREGDNYWIYNNTDGIVQYKSGKIRKFDNVDHIKDLSVSALTSDKHKNLIAGTKSGRIYYLKNKNNSITVSNQISQEDGIIGSDIRWVIADDSNRLWLATNKGLNMIANNDLCNKGSKRIRFFNEENGFFDKQSFKVQLDSNGFINAVSAKNYFKIDPDELVRKTEKTCKLIIERIDVNFKENKWSDNFKTDPWTGIPTNEVVLPYNKNTLMFYFHLLQIAEPTKAQYSYKLCGLQNEWTQYTSEAKAVFTTLRDGKYVLKIRGRLLSSPEIVSEAEYSFRILPPWWSTWWFCLIILISGVTIMLLVFNMRVKQIRRESEINRRMAELKMEALKSQMNPHFIFNAFNSIQKYILQKDTKAALDYMSEFASLIRQTIDISTKESITLDDGYKYLTSYIDLEKRRSQNFEYRIDIDPRIDMKKMSIPPMLVQPFVENAILHGIRHLKKKGKLLLKLDLSAGCDMLICTIEDNGIGRAQSAEINKLKNLPHIPRGTKNTLQRIQLLGYESLCIDLYDEAGNPAGTKVILNIHL